jgi:hypothetical protein
VVHHVSIARPLGAGRCDVSQWGSAFVTYGGVRRLHHDGGPHLYSPCQPPQGVNGLIQDAGATGFTSDLPAFSSRPYHHRGVLPVDAPRLTGVEARLNPPGEGRRVGAFQALLTNLSGEVHELWLARPKGIYRLAFTRRADDLEVRLRNILTPDGWDEFFHRDLPQHAFMYPGMGPLTRDEAFRRLGPPLACQEHGGTAAFMQRLVRPGPEDVETAELLVYADAPPSLNLAGEELQAQHGRVLYVLPVTLNEPER